MSAEDQSLIVLFGLCGGVISVGTVLAFGWSFGLLAFGLTLLVGVICLVAT